jgi:hypothetical protein
MTMIIMKNELEVGMTYFKVLSQHLPRGAEERHNISQNARSLD